jgi:hypothetical protein
MRQEILILFPETSRRWPYILDLDEIPSVELGDFPPEKPVLFNLKLYFHSIEQFWFIGYCLSRAGSRQFDRVELGTAQAYATHFNKTLPSVPSPIMTEPKPARKARHRKRVNVPAFKALILEAFAKKSPSIEIEIHFDDIRDRCHDGRPVSDETVRRDTLQPTRKEEDFPYRIREKTKKDGHYAIVTKIVIPPKVPQSLP